MEAHSQGRRAGAQLALMTPPGLWLPADAAASGLRADRRRDMVLAGLCRDAVDRAPKSWLRRSGSPRLVGGARPRRPLAGGLALRACDGGDPVRMRVTSLSLRLPRLRQPSHLSGPRPANCRSSIREALATHRSPKTTGRFDARTSVIRCGLRCTTAQIMSQTAHQVLCLGHAYSSDDVGS